MPLPIPNTTLGDQYTPATTFGGPDVLQWGFFTVANNAAFVQLLEGVAGQSHPQPEVYCPPATYPVAPGGRQISGIRARNAVAGSNAQFFGALFYPNEPGIQAGTPFPTIVGASGGVSNLVTPPIGAIVGYGGTADPPGWLICDGRAISRATYALLFAAISTLYGVGDGVTTFNIPDLRGRVAVGLGTNASVNALAASDGVAVANRRPQHRHTPHSHVVQAFNGAGAGGRPTDDTRLNVGATFSTNTADGGSGVGTDSLNAPAHLVVNYIIATGV